MQLTLNYCDIADVFEITPPLKVRKTDKLR